MGTIITTAIPAHPLDKYMLRDMSGWVGAAREDVGASPTYELNAWLQLLDASLSAAPRGAGGNWKEAHERAEQTCVYPLDVDRPPGWATQAEPGTEAYQDGLLQTAPDDAWRDSIRCIGDSIGIDRFSQTLGRWYQAATKGKPGLLNRPGPDRDMLRGLIWCALAVPAIPMIERLRQLAIWSIQHRTAQATMIGLALAATESEQAAAALRLIALNAKRPSPKQRFERLALHVERRAGISLDDSGERFVPTCGFAAVGIRSIDLPNGCRCDMQVNGQDIAIVWTNDNGKRVAAPPMVVKRQFAAELKEIKASQKDAERTLIAQRDRIDRILGAPRVWSLQAFRQCYLDHALVATLARRLIWVVDGAAVMFAEDAAHDVDGRVVAPEPEAEVTLWHPVNRPADEVVAWRRRLEDQKITQPFKQAHREVYMFTDAERHTSTYSNRFAAHILRQHQFAALCRGRGWEFRKMGAWDGGISGHAQLKLSPFELRAEFWLQATSDDVSPVGIYLCLATDQVRFYRDGQAEPIPLDQVPPLAFSEVMRDVDLFVGVASVGNDPNWQDGGPEGRYRDYWHSYSFGELTETAKTRRQVLERLVPRLKIAPRCSFSDKFLIVRGDIRSYKIHLGSGNILMEPNDQYLCIVPSRGSNQTDNKDIFLPFEGDGTLSVIISKAFLLAEDTKITDATITRQIREH